MTPALSAAFLGPPLAHRGFHDLSAKRPENSRAAVRAAIQRDPKQVETAKYYYCGACGGYHYPLHIAICHQASLEVLQLLVEAGSWILRREDGPHRYTPLALTLVTVFLFTVSNSSPMRIPSFSAVEPS